MNVRDLRVALAKTLQPDLIDEAAGSKRPRFS